MNIRKVNSILKYLQVLIMVGIFYICVLLIEKFNVLKYILTILKLMVPLFIGIVIAWLLKPIISFLEKRMNKVMSVILVYIVLLFFVYILIINFVPTFISEFDEFVKIFPSMIDKLFSNIKIDMIISFKDDIICGIDELLLNIRKSIPDTCMNILSGISNFILGLIISFYLLISNNDYDLKYLVKKKTYNLLIKINGILRGYVKGTLLSSFLVFILSTISFYILGLKGALLYGFICGVTNIIPFIGPYIGASIPVLIAFTKSISFGIIMSIVIFVIQTVEGDIIGPLIMSKNVNVHPITSIISLLIFGYFFGIIGMIIAVPIIAIGKELYLYYRKN